MNHGKELLSLFEQERIDNLIKIIPKRYSTLLDIGARDGYISGLLSYHFKTVTALDLEKPRLAKENIIAVKGDVTCLGFPNNSFDVILCTEVLEHISPRLLNNACNEIIRVAKRFVIIGVPYKQDIRYGRTTCSYCRKKNPPWGHVNSFEEEYVKELFSPLCLESVSLYRKKGMGKDQCIFNALDGYSWQSMGNIWSRRTFRALWQKTHHIGI